MEGCFIEKYDPTIEDSYQKIVELLENEGKDTLRCQLDILDTAGTEQFAAMRELYMRDGDVFMLVYSITSTISFEEVKKMHDQLLQVNPKGALNALLVGNKHDLTDDRVVQTSEGNCLASEWSIPFLETSALNGTNVDTAFTTIPQKLMNAVPQRNIKSRRVCCMIV